MSKNPRWPLLAMLDLHKQQNRYQKWILHAQIMQITCITLVYATVFSNLYTCLIEIQDGRHTPSWIWGRTCVSPKIFWYSPKVCLCQRKHLYYILQWTPYMCALTHPLYVSYQHPSLDSLNWLHMCFGRNITCF